MNLLDLNITEGKDEQWPYFPYINFFISRNDGQREFVGEIFYNNPWEWTIKIIRLHTANLVKNTLIDPQRFWEIPSKKYPWLWIACLSRFIQEIKTGTNSKKITLVSVPDAIWFYRKAAKRLLVNWIIVDWKEWRWESWLSKMPVWVVKYFWDVSDYVFEFTL